MYIREPKDEEHPFTRISNRVINDKRLSLRAKGLMAYLLSKRDDWQVYESEIVSSNRDGRESVKAAVGELMEHGYLRREQTRTNKGRLAYLYTVTECPDTANHIREAVYGEPSSINNLCSNDLRNNNSRNNKKDKEHPLTGCVDAQDRVLARIRQMKAMRDIELPF